MKNLPRPRWPTRLHRFLRQRFFYPLALASALAMAMYLAERYLGHGWRGPRLHLNLFLAWVPYASALIVAATGLDRRRRGVHGLCGVAFVGWFIFFPNAPYLITDFAYLDWTHYDLWQRVAIFATFAFCGLMLALVSLTLFTLSRRQDSASSPAGSRPGRRSQPRGRGSIWVDF